MNDPSILRLAVPAMTRLLVAWLVWGSFLLGLGLALLRVLGANAINSDRLIVAFWLGVAGVIGFLQIWHLVMPVATPGAAAVAALGIAGLAWNFRGLRAWAKQRDSASRLLPLLLLAVVAVWLSDRALIGTDLYDSGLYHEQVVRWEQTYAIVPGLANVHTRFGFNNASLLVVAMMGGGRWADRGAQVFHGLLVLGLWAPGILAMVRVFRSRTAAPRPIDVLTTFLLPAAYLMSVNAANPELASPSTDLPAAAVTLISVCLLFAYLDDRGEPDHSTGGMLDTRLTVLAVLLPLAVCIKLSAAAYAATASLVAGVAWWRRCKTGDRQAWATPIVALLAAALLLGPWIARGVLLSGYPLFPSKLLAAPVSWRVPPELVDQTQAAIETFTGGPAPAGNASESWLARLWRQARVQRPLAMAQSLLYAAVLILIAVALVARCRRTAPAPGTAGTAPAATSAGWWLLLPWGVATVAWLATAPAWRFAWHLFFIPPAVATAMLVELWAPSPAGDDPPSTRRVRLVLPWALLLVLIFRVQDLLFHAPLITPPGMDHGMEPLHHAQLQVRTTKSGLRVYVPTKGDQCWDGNLPCTPQWRPGLRLREPDDASAGFQIAH